MSATRQLKTNPSKDSKRTGRLSHTFQKACTEENLEIVGAKFKGSAQ